MMTEIVQVTTTTATREEADRIAGQLVGRRVAACVQVVGPITSTYRWKGEVETAQEWLAVCKTTADRYPALEEALLALHPYEVPEILALAVLAGAEAYVRWVEEQVRD
jgi:periplasmic divalent cation tolerance protein